MFRQPTGMMKGRHGLGAYLRMSPKWSVLSRQQHNRVPKIADIDPSEVMKDDWLDRVLEKRTYRKPYVVNGTGLDIINNSLLNKGTAFHPSERDRLNIRGLVPSVYNSPLMQVARVLNSYKECKSDLERFSFLMALQDRNEILFYRLLSTFITELAPIVYTPTVGVACQEFGHIFRKPRGMYFSKPDRYEFSSMVYNWPYKDVDVIVVTDGSRILGLGDLGAHGMGIPIGKLSLYVAAGGIHPARVLPIMLDVGTDNEKLLQDPLYIGVREPRLKGEKYYSLMDEFMRAIHFRYPNVLVQFEDFSNENARNILDKYRNKYLCFNDDIQGTGAVALAGVLSALRAQGKQPKDIKSQKVVCLGAGSAGLGVVDSLVQGMVEEGMDITEARKNVYLIDVNGLLGKGRTNLSDQQRLFQRADLPDGMGLKDVISTVQPTVLLGLSGVAKAFTEEAVREMAKTTDRPIIFPMSNPSSKAECLPEDALKWTNGKAIIASGSPFEPVVHEGTTHYFGQANNFYIFPGVGLGAIVAKSRTVTDSMFYAASKQLASCVDEPLLKAGMVYPSTDNIKEVARQVAVAVAKVVRDEGHSKDKEMAEKTDDELDAMVTEAMWSASYVPLVEDAWAIKKKK